MQHSRPTLVFKPLIPLLLTLFLFPLSPPHRLIILLFLYTSFFLLSLIPLGFFNGMPEVSEPGVLNFYTLFHLILLTLFVYRSLTLIHLNLSESLDSLLCNLITPTLGLALFLLMPRTLAAASFFSSDRAYSSRNFLPPLFLRLTPILIM